MAITPKNQAKSTEITPTNVSKDSITPTNTTKNDATFTNIEKTTITTYSDPVVLDSYSESNYSSAYINSSSDYLYGQSFSNTIEILLDSCKFYLSKNISPSGTATAKLYLHSGTYGTSSRATGEPVATSNAVDISSLVSGPQLVTFTFSEKITLDADTKYVIVLDLYSASSNGISIKRDSTSPSHSGNTTLSSNGINWSVVTVVDLIFYVYGTTSTQSSPILTNQSKSSAISPTNQTKNSITPVNSTKNSITPINSIKNSITPINLVKDNITPTNQSKNSITPTNQTKNSITPTNRAKN